jgi:hypothetical protein
MPLYNTLINLRRELIRTFAVVDEWFDKEYSLRSFKPPSGGWSINEVLEHIMLTNHFLFVLIDKGKTKALKKREILAASFVVPEHYSLENRALVEVSDPNLWPWHRPEHHQPLGQRSMFDVRREIRDHLDRCLITLEELPNGEGTLHQTTMSVNNLGKLDVYQYVYFLALHAQRHLRQMERIEVEALKCLSV